MLGAVYLGIESSCDESALALFDARTGVVAKAVYSQVGTHRPYGGIVPDLASREHIDAFIPLLHDLFGCRSRDEVTLIAVTAGPGLASCLVVGVALARSLGLALGVSVVGVNHLRGHAYSPFIQLHEEDPGRFERNLQQYLPHLGLIVSGGNTLLFKMSSPGDIQLLGQTLDDAAGEALDKGAKLLGMPYPGGPLIEKEALQGDPGRFDFPRGMARSAQPNFSFSGLKTSLRYQLEKMSDRELKRDLPDLCASYQQAVVDALCTKTGLVLRRGAYRSLGLSGGVANNRILRRFLRVLGDRFSVPVFSAQPAHAGDNAEMIAFAAFCDPAGTQEPTSEVAVKPNWELVG